MSRQLRAGIISANWGMTAHLPAWRANGVEVAAVCTAHEETAHAAAIKYGIEKAYWDYRKLVADPSLDIIDVGTRPDLRRDMVLAALAHGKHVFASANFAADIDAAREMRDAARESGTVCMLDSTLAAIPAHRQLGRAIADGDIGAPVSVSARFQISLFNGPSPIGAHWRWFGEKRHGASAMRNLGTHSLHCLIDMLGPVEAVIAQERFAQREWRFPDGSTQVPEVADTAQLMLRFAAGTIGTLELGWANPALPGWYLQLNGTTASLVAESPGNFFPTSRDVSLRKGRNAQPFAPLAIEPVALPDIPASAPPQATDIARLLKRFVTAIRGDEKPAQPDFDRAFHVEAVLEAARRAIVQESWVAVAEVGE